MANIRQLGFLAAMALGMVAGCADGPAPTQPSLYTNLNQTGVKVDPVEALAIINNYRLNHGLNPLELNDKLAAAAQEQADAMASADKVSHALTRDKTLKKRMDRAGYDAANAAENISAGYWTLAEAFSGWRDSKRHNANMLRKGVTEMGIATQFRPDAKYKVFWALIVAAPDEREQRPRMDQSLPISLLTQ